MPPHSATECNYDPWAHFQNTSIFCGSGLRAKPTMTSDSLFDEREVAINLPPAPQYPGGFRRLSKPRRNVIFKEEVDIYEIPNVRELAKSQLAEMYMTKEEMSAIHAEAWEHVELMDLGIEYAESNSYSKRGLTDLRGEHVERRRRQREQAYKVVFGLQNIYATTNAQQQQQQQQQPSYSPQIMAELYGQVSLPSKSHAQRTAMYDTMAVERL